MKETQESIYRWARSTFGPTPYNMTIAVRALEEMAELMAAIEAGETPAAIVEEVADVCIVLCQIPEIFGLDLGEAIDRKMQINRAREWRTNGDGTGQHVEGVRG